MNRKSEISRKTRETEIVLKLNIDGSGKGYLQTGIGFFDHLIDSFRKHGQFDFDLKAVGDLHIDGHHTVEDTGIVLGKGFEKALGDCTGITRFGNAYCPLDESLARAVVDISGRGFFYYNNPLPPYKVGDFEGELFPEFLRAFANNAKITLHVELLHGQNQHHAYEAMIKAVARALKMAASMDSQQTGIPSTKGVI